MRIVEKLGGRKMIYEIRTMSNGEYITDTITADSKEQAVNIAYTTNIEAIRDVESKIKKDKEAMLLLAGIEMREVEEDE